MCVLPTVSTALSIVFIAGTMRYEYKTVTKGYVTGKLYKFLNLATKLMSKSTSRHSISSKSVSCANPSSLQWFASKCPITKSSSGAMLQRGQG